MKDIIAQYTKKHSGVTMEKLNLEGEADVAGVKEFSKNQSLFDSFRLGVINIGLKPFLDGLAEILKSYLESKNVILVISAEKKLPKDFIFLLKPPAGVKVLAQEFAELSGAKLNSFIKKEIEKRNLEFSSELVSLLIGIHGSDLWGMVNDLDKLALGGKIEGNIKSQNIFPLLNRIKRGDLTALEILLSTQEPAMLFNMLAAGADSYLKTKMANYDVAIKSGKITYREALTDLTLG